MEKTSTTSSSERQKYIAIMAGVWGFVGIIGGIFGSVLWFHFPYLLFLDQWHFLWATVALSCGLILSQLILDQLAVLSLSRLLLSENERGIYLELQQNLVKILLGILGIILIEVIMRWLGVSSALRGLVILAMSTSLLWSSRLYWLTFFQNR